MSLNDELDALRAQIAVLQQKVGERYRGPVVEDPPVRPYRQIIKDSNDPGYVNRLLIATPSTGLVRMEWAAQRWSGQVIPTNWSSVQMVQYINAFIPLRYQVADAQNIICREFVAQDFEWLLLIEHDVILPAHTFRAFNNYIIDKQHPVVSGLYYTRSRPSEPILYRGRGTGFYSDWNFGDLVWVDGVPTGCLLIHGGLIRAMWDESEEYAIQHPDGRREETRRVFDTPRGEWFDQETGSFNISAGTSDLDWCTRVMDGGFFEKAGWDEYQELEYPFLVDTNIFCRHINPDGEQFP